MKLDIPAIDVLDDEIEGSDEEEFAPWVDMDVDSSDDETEGPPVEEYAGLPQTTASSAEIDNLTEIVLEDWDPFHLEYEEASSQCLLRVQEDMLDLSKNPLTGVYIDPVDTNRFVATMVGHPRAASSSSYCSARETTRCGRRAFALSTPTMEASMLTCRRTARCASTFWAPRTRRRGAPRTASRSVLVAIQSLLTEKP
ncbi:hypothetical protein MTO96_011163 [Rhipicephalus appendiculatus]